MSRTNIGQVSAANIRRKRRKVDFPPARLLELAKIREGPAISDDGTHTISTPTSGEDETTAAKRYHHGDLAEALVAESRRIIAARGVEAFKIADACRALGVSTAAPYRHFPDRDALIGAIVASAFQEMTEAMRSARDAHPHGSTEGLVAMGQTYVRFAATEPEMFHLMWGAAREIADCAPAQAQGTACFGLLIETVERLRATQRLEHISAEGLALPLWSGVHGLANLMLHGKLEKLGDVDLDQTVDYSTRAFLRGLGAA